MPFEEQRMAERKGERKTRKDVNVCKIERILCRTHTETNNVIQGFLFERGMGCVMANCEAMFMKQLGRRAI